jgi:hypothetical protein
VPYVALGFDGMDLVVVGQIAKAVAASLAKTVFKIE